MEPETAPLPSTPEGAHADAAPDAEPRRGLLIALITVAAAILVALIVLIVALVGSQPDKTAGPAPQPTVSESAGAEETESPEPTDEPTESPSETEAPPPAPQSPSFATFSGPDRADCPSTSDSVDMTWSWSSTDAVAAWFGVGTDNAKAEPYESVPTTATYTFAYQCSETSQRYTVTLEDAAGQLTHRTVEVVRQ